MISRLEIKGFKSLVDVSIELGAVNVFVGANGSGKSNLLEAVGMLGAIASGRFEAESLRYRGVRLGVPLSYCTSLKDLWSAPIALSAIDSATTYRTAVLPNPHAPARWNVFKEDIDHGGRKLIERRQDGIDVYGEPEGDFARLPYNSDAKTDARTNVNLSTLGLMTLANGRFSSHSLNELEKKRASKRADEVLLFLDELISFAVYSPSTPQLRGFLDDIHRDPIGLGGSGLAEAILEMGEANREMLGPFDIEDVLNLIDWADEIGTESLRGIGLTETPVRLRISDRYMGLDHKWLSALESSEGALYVLFLIALVGHPRSPKIFALDNFDQALHPRLACALTRLISEQIVDDGSRQMLATTHNPLVLDGLDLLDDRIRLFTVDRDSTGASQVRRVLVTEELMAKADEGFSLSQLWTTGRLGGVPKDIF